MVTGRLLKLTLRQKALQGKLYLDTYIYICILISSLISMSLCRKCRLKIYHTSTCHTSFPQKFCCFFPFILTSTMGSLLPKKTGPLPPKTLWFRWFPPLAPARRWQLWPVSLARYFPKEATKNARCLPSPETNSSHLKMKP